MLKNKTERLTVSGLCLALGIILPYVLAHGAGLPGTVLLPMHAPVLLCGLLCGPLYGTLCGCALPLLNCLLTGMPAPFPMLPIMLCELTVYGCVSGLLFSKTPLGNQKWGSFVALPLAMLWGRTAYAAAFYLLLLFQKELGIPTVTAAVITGLPGIILQLLIIPQLVLVIKKFSR